MQTAARTTQTVADLINLEWACGIASNITDDILNWEADSHCGAETLRIIRLAEFVCAEWPDAKDEVYLAAIRQISVVCVG
jgi:hypothetical protein